MERGHAGEGSAAALPLPPEHRLGIGAAAGMSPAQRERAIGLIVGAAVGDALGAPFEFLAGGTYRRAFPTPRLTGTGEMVGGGSFGWAPGEFTDDTQMAVVLAERLIADGTYDPDRLWDGWRRWARDASDVGNTTARALSASDWRDASHPDVRWTAGNGTLMRCFPLALAYLDASDEVARAVTLHHSALTHPHPDAGAGTWLAVAAMRAAVRGADPWVALESALEGLPPESRDTYAPILDEAWTPGGDGLRNVTVWGCLAQAVWAVRSTDSYEDAVVAAVDRGDDADTVACVTGALAGAVHGIQAIPSRWATHVHGHVTLGEGTRTYRLEDLQALALRLVGASVAPLPDEEAPAGPVEVAPRLHAANLGGASQAPEDWAVVSLCRTGTRFDGRAHRRQLYLIDRPGGHNSGLQPAIADAIAAIDAFLAEGRDVVVHCHGGRSRTGLVLKAWWMRTTGSSEREAHAWLAERWSLYDDYEASFVDFLANAWGGRGATGRDTL
jgi:ADP-ribosyl-[dinitrogen reductase] hydrolase